MKLLYGTSNPAKLEHMKEMLQGLDVEIVEFNEIKMKVGEIDESGNDPLDHISIDEKSGKYYMDIEDEESYEEKVGEGFRKFFIKALDL